MILRKFSGLSLMCVLGFAIHTPNLAAEEIRIPIGEQAKDQAEIEMPTKGMSKERVKALFGEPELEFAAQGQPPISRWKYPEFTVYFDSNTVIHCVRSFHPKTTSSAETSSTN
ncbi:MAG TPA: hypothetical protein VLC79_12065 [Cellvibrio sp.]|nr:hypothetical protein [Cellvibrio sp.]